MQKKTLFLITSNFPYGKYESFLEPEYPYLAKAFDQIYIISNQLPIEEIRDTSINTKVSFLKYLPSFREKLSSLTHILNREVLKEILKLSRLRVSIYSPGILATVLSSFNSGKRLVHHIEKIIEQDNLKNNRIFAYSYWCNDMAVGLALLKTQNPQIKCICRAHGYDVYFERNKINYLPLRKFIFKNLDQIHFVSSDGYTYSQSRIGKYPSMRVSYLGTKFYRKKKKIHHKVLKLVSCSSINSVKRIHLIIESLRNIKNLNIQWIHIGGGEMFEEIKEQAECLLKDHSNIGYLLLGHQSHQWVTDFFLNEKIDLFINTSSAEGLPVSIMEALSYSIPAIALDVGGNNEIIENNFNGFLLKATASSNEISQAIINYSLLSREEKLVLMNNAFFVWQSKFNASKNYPRFIDELLQ